MNNHKVIFVAGIHGVGKTTLCNELSSKFNMNHFSASDLIARERETQRLRNKRVEDIDGNQDHLIVAIDKLFNNTDWYLLDGHFCLLNQDNEVTRIPYSTYEGIAPTAVLVLVDEPTKIYDRLILRDDTKYDLAVLKAFQEEEIAYAEFIRDNLNIPYLQSNPTTGKDDIFTFVDSSMS